MDRMDWTGPARLHERDDSGSDMYFDFRVLKEGTLAQLVAHVASLDGDARARLVIDSSQTGSIGISDILALAARDDFPGGEE